MTRGEFVHSVGLITGMDETAGGDELALLQRWANDAVLEFLQRTHCYTQKANVALQAGMSEYTADITNILAVVDWQFPDIADYDRVSMDELDDLRRIGSSRLAYATHFYDFEINPTPSSAMTLTLRYVPKPTPMTADGNDPSTPTYGGVPAQFHRGPELWMLYRAAEYDEKRLPLTSKDYLQQFIDYCGYTRRTGRTLGGRKLNATRVGYPGSRGNRRNDTYPVV